MTGASNSVKPRLSGLLERFSHQSGTSNRIIEPAACVGGRCFPNSSENRSSDYNGLRERIATTLQREPRSELGDLNPASKGGNTRRALVRPIHCFVVRRWMEPGFPGSSIAQYNRLSQETRKN